MAIPPFFVFSGFHGAAISYYLAQIAATQRQKAETTHEAYIRECMKNEARNGKTIDGTCADVTDTKLLT